MEICIRYCENCGAIYEWQSSGSCFEEVTDEKFGTATHCYDCNLIYKHYNKLMQDELNKIEKKTLITYIETDEISLKTLLEWGHLNIEEAKAANKANPFGLVRQCYPSLSRKLPNGKFETERKEKKKN